MNSAQVIEAENVARLLKPSWVSDGMIASAAFTFRPRIHETYISVLRENMPTFFQNAMRIAHGKSTTLYASFSADDLKSRKDSLMSEVITYDVKAIDNDKILSHAGIFVAINGHYIVGGEPFASFVKQKGIAEDAVLLDVSEQMAGLTQKNIKTLE